MRCAALAALAWAASAAAQTCTPAVEPMRTGFGLDAPAQHSAIFDEDGAGGASARLFLSGAFTSAAGAGVDSLVRWDGEALSAVAGAPPGFKGAMRVFDDGTGAALYIAGSAGVVHRYRVGGQWDQVAAPLFGGIVGQPVSFAAFDPDGAGPRPVGLFALVHYGGIPGEQNSVLWRYDADGWYRLSGPVPVGKIIAYDPDGAGPGLWELYHYYNVKRPAPHRIVGYMWRLRQDHWEFVTHTSGTDDLGIQDATVFYNDHQSRPRLVITGGFGSVWRPSGGYLSSSRVAAWDGSEWEHFIRTPGAHFEGTAVGAYYGAGTPRLVVGGPVGAANSAYSLWEARWTGDLLPTTPWRVFDGSEPVEADRVSVVREFDPDGAGPRESQLVLSGEIHLVRSQRAEHFAAWTPTGGFEQVLPGPDGPVRAFEVFADGNGRSLYAAGNFRRIGSEPIAAVARWSGAGWERVGEGLGGFEAPSVSSMAVHNDGSGWALYAALHYQEGGWQHPRANVARWDGTSWELLTPVGATNTQFGWPGIYALASHDPDGPGQMPSRLYAGGRFQTMGGVAARDLAVWDGVSWAAVPGYQLGWITTMKSLDDGSGRALYIGGDVLSAGGLASTHAVRLRPSGWEGFPAFPSGQFARIITDIALDGTAGDYRPVAVFFTYGFAGRTVYRLDGSSWTNLLAPADMDGEVARNVVDANGPSLYVGRHRYTGSGWERLEPFPAGAVSVVDPPVRAISPVWDDGTGPSVFIGGTFTAVGEGPAREGTGRVARVRICPPPVQGGCYANCDGSTAQPVLNVADFGCFLRRFASGDAWANCDQSTAAPVLNVADFACLLQRFAAGCP